MAKKLHTKIEDRGSSFNKLFTWHSPERAWEPKDRAWFVSYSFFFVVFIALAALLEEYILVLLIIAFSFLWFVQASIAPEIVEHTITNMGIRTFGKLFKWKSIKHFWISKKSGDTFLNLEIEDYDTFKSDRKKRLSLIIDEKDEEMIFELFIENVDYGDKDEVDYNFLTRLTNGKHMDMSKYMGEEDGSGPIQKK